MVEMSEKKGRGRPRLGENILTASEKKARQRKRWKDDLLQIEKNFLDRSDSDLLKDFVKNRTTDDEKRCLWIEIGRRKGWFPKL